MIVNQTNSNVDTNLKSALYSARLTRLFFILILPVVFIGLGILFWAAGGIDPFFPIFLFLMALTSAVFFAFFYPSIIKKAIAKTIPTHPVVKYTFHESDFTAERQLGGGSIRNGYNMITKCEEYADMWIIRTKSESYPVLKEGMFVGTAEDLSVFLGVKLGERFVVKYKKR